MATPADSNALPYEEPHIEDLLVILSFVFLLNSVNHIVDTKLYCGLVGQIFIGIVWGTPLANWLSRSFQEAAVQLGYIGLILLVYEGGLQTNLTSLMSDLPLSMLTAITGIVVPIALSYTLIGLADANAVQCFAAGAALSATSLGTTFSILTSAQLTTSRLGVLLTSAAMIDDVIGLVMIQVVASLGDDSGTPTGHAVGRVLGATAGLLLVSVGGALLLRRMSRFPAIFHLMSRPEIALILHCTVLLILLTAAGFAGASVLFAAFLAGVITTWAFEHCQEVADTGVSSSKVITGMAAYEHYLAAVVDRVLKPFFFASIGFSIPIKDMFRGSTMWRGLVYTILMTLAKLSTGIWLACTFLPPHLLAAMDPRSYLRTQKARHDNLPLSARNEVPHTSTASLNRQDTQTSLESAESAVSHDAGARPADEKPTAIACYSPGILGLAMVARGEIAFLIASVANRRGIFDGNEEMYLIIIWAAMLCTVVGPISVGLVVKAMRAREPKPEVVLGERLDEPSVTSV
ncbi:Na+/H+ antiporter [Powellomyces hirtus]|nr:Na+/H+ antiporter [Powellomyces hirtus]